jgi:hypothetical protein
MVAPQQWHLSEEHRSFYERIIPEHNLLRKINGLIDFSFVYDELANKYCHINGRAAQCPIRMFKYLLLKTIYDISDVDVVERSGFDMSFKYFLGISPEEQVINPSSLTKFRKLRLKDTDLLNLLIHKTVSLAIEKGIIRSKSMIVDATHTLSRSNPFSAIEVLRERSKQLRKALYHYDEAWKGRMPAKNTDNDLEKELAYCKELEERVEKDASACSIPALQEKLNIFKETMEDTQEKLTFSKDEDARTGHKSTESSFFGYKTHLAMGEERIITAAVVTSGEKGDGPQLARLLEISQENGIQVDTIIGDAAYSGKENIKLAHGENIKIVAKLNPSITQGVRKDEDKFDYNKDADMFVCPQGHMAVRKARQGKKNNGTNQTDTYYFDVEKCKSCPFREGCYKEGAKTKTYSVSIKSDTHQQQMAFQETEYFKEKSKQRYKIEAKNGELKNAHGYGRAKSYGIHNMELQGAITIFVVNLKRIIKMSL